ncbi:hypothetical protein [Wolbachia pipientis]|nr:hypothetical protein [Wolbachia pipientis]
MLVLFFFVPYFHPLFSCFSSGLLFQDQLFLKLPLQMPECG